VRVPNVRLNIHLIPLACRLGSGGTFGTCPNDGDEGFLPAPISKVIIGSNGVLSEEQYDPENPVLMFDVVYQDLTSEHGDMAGHKKTSKGPSKWENGKMIEGDPLVPGWATQSCYEQTTIQRL
jgi:hypothetical protein